LPENRTGKNKIQGKDQEDQSVQSRMLQNNRVRLFHHTLLCQADVSQVQSLQVFSMEDPTDSIKILMMALQKPVVDPVHKE